MAVPPDGGWSDKHQERAANAGWDSYEAWIAAIEEERGGNICGAWRRNGHRPCAARINPKPSNPKGRCKAHGRDSPAGVEHYRFGQGERIYSKRLEGILLSAYEGSLDRGPDQLRLGEQIALVDALEADAVDRFVEARKEDDPEAIAAAKSEIVGLAQQRRKLVEAERRRIEAARDAISRERLEALAAYLVTELRQSILRVVEAPDERRQLLGEVSDAIARLAEGRRTLGSPDENGGRP